MDDNIVARRIGVKTLHILGAGKKARFLWLT